MSNHMSDPRYPDWGPVEFESTDDYFDALEECNCSHDLIPDPGYRPWVSALCPVHDHE